MKMTLWAVVGIFVFVIIVIALGSAVAPIPQPTQQIVHKASVKTPLTVATSSMPTASVDKKKAASILSASVNYYKQLFATGKATLGTRQYTDANAGLKAFDDPNSAATRFGAFRTNTCLKNDPGANAISAYQAADNLYPSNSPEALGNWNYDMAMLATHICEWAQDGVSWQIKEVTNAQLQADEQKITADFNTVQADMSTLTK
jgi:hypothetical protein